MNRNTCRMTRKEGYDSASDGACSGMLTCCLLSGPKLNQSGAQAPTVVIENLLGIYRLTHAGWSPFSLYGYLKQRHSSLTEPYTLPGPRDEILGVASTSKLNLLTYLLTDKPISSSLSPPCSSPLQTSAPLSIPSDVPGISLTHAYYHGRSSECPCLNPNNSPYRSTRQSF